MIPRCPNADSCAPLDELPPGAMKLVDVGKFGVGVYNVHGAMYAIVNYCSHEGAPLCLGLIGGTNEAAPEDPTGCAGYATGRSSDALGTIGNSTSPRVKIVADPRRRVRTYQVDVSDGEVYLTA